MNDQDSIQKYNRNIWDQIASAGDDYFLSLTQSEIEEAKSGCVRIKVTPTKWVPTAWIGPVNDLKVLCLACGGGQQAPLFAAAGACVTVFDISGKQLLRDRQAAEQHDLQLDYVAGDMADLSALRSQQFDLIINPCSVCYCPDVPTIWHEAATVLKPGGRLITGFIKPINYVFDPVAMEEERQLIVNRKIPYSDLQLAEGEREQILGSERPLEFGHSLSDLIGAQLSAGLKVTGFYEDRWGDDDPLSDHIDVFAATLAVKA